MNAYLGIDTSNYVTSVALVGEQGRILCHARHPLPVEHGALGLRQSDAVFCHIRQLAPLVRQAFDAGRGAVVRGVGVSTQPRAQQGSYMPVFLAGRAIAESVAAALGVPVCSVSHQQGHLRAAEIGLSLPRRYVGVHLSGGTTELLEVDKQGYTARILGATRDIAAGQWVDRTGVALGLDFPAGRALEQLAGQTQTAHPFTVAVKGCDLYFSGAETQTKRALTNGVPGDQIARGVFVSLGEALARAVLHAAETTGLGDALVAGGVSANAIVKRIATGHCAKKNRDLRIVFADPLYGGDNAVGVALLAKEALC